MEDVPYGRILREGWLIILLVALFGAGAAYGIAKALPETYAATSGLLLQVDSNEASLFERNQFSLARIKSYPALIDSPAVVDSVRRELDLSEDDYSDRDIRRMLSAENTADTVLLVVRAEAPTAAMAADMANAAAGSLSSLIESTENSEDDDRYQVNLDQVLPAVEPVEPVSPQVLAITGLGLIGGFAIGAIIAVFRTTTNRRISTIADVRRASGFPVVGRIPKRSGLPFVSRRREGGAAQDAAFEDTVNNLAALGGAGIARYVLIPASPDAINDEALRGLLDAFGTVGRRACILDARAEAPTPAHARSLDGLLVDASSARDASRADSGRAVYALTTPVPLAELERELPAAMLRLESEFDVVLVVTDPGASSLIQASAATGAGIVVFVRGNATSATELLSVATRLRVMDVRPLGVLITHAPSRAVGGVAESWRDSDRHQGDVDAVVPGPSRPAAAPDDGDDGGVHGD